MKVTKEQAQANRRRVVETASGLFRDHGFEGIGVAELMKASGLTHGGFYRHFESKDDLAAEATGLAYEQLRTESEGTSIETLLARYISSEHRDDPAHGCPTSALGGDAMRQNDQVQAAFAEGVSMWLGLIGNAIGEKAPKDAQARAKVIDLAARAVGAIVLARASAADGPLSNEILRTCLSTALGAAKEEKYSPRTRKPGTKARPKARTVR